jgi:hypothetical protein
MALNQSLLSTFLSSRIAPEKTTEEADHPQVYGEYLLVPSKKYRLSAVALMTHTFPSQRTHTAETSLT